MEEHLPGGGEDSDDEESSAGGSTGEGGEEGDPEGRMPGQLQPEAASTTVDYATKKANAQSAIKALLGKEVVIKHKTSSMTWTVIDDWDPADAVQEDPLASFGLKDFNPKDYTQQEVLARLFLHLC